MSTEFVSLVFNSTTGTRLKIVEMTLYYYFLLYTIGLYWVFPSLETHPLQSTCFKVRAMIVYDGVAKVVGPKKEARSR